MKKIKRYIDKLYLKCCNYRDKHGYRENLGYDQKYKFQRYMNKFDLTYQEECELSTYFYNKMESI